MKYIVMISVVLLLASTIPVSAQGQGEQADTLYQVSTLDALLDGDYDGRIDFYTIKQQGDFGLGTFAALDGEMIALDGVFYQVRDDGHASLVRPDQMTPFAAVTYFRKDDSFHVSEETSCTGLHELLLEKFPSDQSLFAIKVSGRFTTLKTRSVPVQEKPYVSLIKALEEQVKFNFAEVDATLVGFWLPEVLNGVNAAGFHFHAIMTDTMTGGHVLDCQVQDVSIEIDYTNKLQVQFADGERTHPPLAKPGRGRGAMSHW